jgi:hypothetical protein
MFAIGPSAADARLFDFSDPLVLLRRSRISEWARPTFCRRRSAMGPATCGPSPTSTVTRFVVAGLLNLLVVIDAHDIALGRK